jgi:hypothetical protein
MWAPMPLPPPILPLPSAPSIPSMPSTPSTDRASQYNREKGNEMLRKKDGALHSIFQKTRDKIMGCIECTQRQLAASLG